MLGSRLLADINQDNGGWTDCQISEALDISQATIERVRKRFVEEGVEAALNRQPRSQNKKRRLDGEKEAHLIALACSSPPEGHARWTIRLLADKLVELELVESISPETVRQTLKKNDLKPWLNKSWVIPPEANAEFVCQMEDVLDVYTRAYDPDYPVICFDETTKQLVSEIKQPLPQKPSQDNPKTPGQMPPDKSQDNPKTPGKIERYDYEYKREGVCNLFMIFEPFAGQRHVTVTDQRTAIDYAHQMQNVVDVLYPDAVKIIVIQDNLNTHTPASLYKAFKPAEAKRILSKLEFHYTPKHGSWLNMAEIEFSVLARQCLDCRIPNKETLLQEVAAFQQRRNQDSGPVNWRFTTEDARIKLERLYPSI